MNEMLHGLNEDRRLAALERENPLHPQDPRAVTMRKQAEPEAERGPADRAVMLNHNKRRSRYGAARRAGAAVSQRAARAI